MQAEVVRMCTTSSELQSLGLDDLERKMAEQGWTEERSRASIRLLSLPAEWAKVRSAEFAPASSVLASDLPAVDVEGVSVPSS